MTTRHVAIVSAGLRSPSTTSLLAADVAEQVRTTLAGQGDEAVVTTVELREHAHGLADALLTGFPSGSLADDVAAVVSADALVVVTPTFSATYSGLFKMFFDVLEEDALEAMPVLLAATGGTERHSLILEHALRPLFSYLGAEPVRTGVYAATSDFGGDGSARLAARVRRAVGELAAALGDWLSTKPPAASSGVDDVVPFAELLAR